MAFAGKYQLETQENYEEFLEATGLQNAKTEHKVVTEVVQDGDNYTWTQTIPGWSWSISFTIGKECEMESIKGVTFKGTVTMKDGKICLQFPEYFFTAEIIDDKLVMICVTPGEKGVAMKRVCKRI
ncbi:PREDICTED: gastrotropin [Cyprinodon variegatus]|uniref:Fatty acid binding protein 6 n=1 Tax=Cyprinodon variegatus TaxID=28743 RepID=A0A3Q2EEF0_CYPVA|nr:PREDICTED: gastrotropin [Cyprinodon variegatus]